MKLIHLAVTGALLVACIQPKPPTEHETIVLAGYEESLDQCIAVASHRTDKKYEGYQECAEQVDIKFGIPHGASAR